MTQLVEDNTFVKNVGQAKSVLDVILTNRSDQHLETAISAPLSSSTGTSGHAVVETTIKVDATTEEPCTRTVRLYKHANFDALRKFLRNVDWNWTQDVEPSADLLTKTITSAMNKFIPSRTVTQNPGNQPWFDDLCRKAHATKQQLYRKYNKTRRTQDKLAYHKAEKRTQNEYKRAKLRYQKRTTEQIQAAEKEPKLWWKLVNKVVHKNARPTIPTLQTGETEACTASAKADKFADMFAAKSRLEPAA
eukprot:Selendium_serpulae@DN10058_c0_g1_i1.p1